MKTHKGIFKPKHPEKYKGNPNNIIWRSSWEFKLMMTLDNHPDVIQWSSEEFFIPYVSPIDNKIHRYFPDFWVKKKTRDGKVDVTVIEVKPMKQTVQPKPQKKVTKAYLNEVKTWGINSSKFKAAQDFCDDKGWEFLIMTEKELGV